MVRGWSDPVRVVAKGREDGLPTVEPAADFGFGHGGKAEPGGFGGCVGQFAGADAFTESA